MLESPIRNNFSFIIQNNLLNSCLLGFRPNDSCVNLLISITDNIYRVFYANFSLEVCGVYKETGAYKNCQIRTLAWPSFIENKK